VEDAPDDVTLDSFACAVGDLARRPQDIPGFDELWRAVSPGTDFGAMGCDTYRRMSAPLLTYLLDSLRASLQDAGVAADRLDHLVLATSDSTLAALPGDLAPRTLEALGARRCVPHLVSFQRCCSSITALRLARSLFADPEVGLVALVGLDLTVEDRDRVTAYAVFGDAVASCLLTRGPGPLRYVSSAVRVDEAGLLGRDTFMSRKQVADACLAAVLAAGGHRTQDVTTVFTANLHKPLALFNAAAAGLRAEQLHFTGTLSSYGHCGNADWMLNLIHYRQERGLEAGDVCLAQSLAQGFHACALLHAC
jgi:3-oxoacyl-[acyl-carrier-protein] synthase III